MNNAEALLAERFGHSAFRPGQRQVIEHLLAGQSAAAVFPTGGGKSLCYQLPALALPGLTVVVSPLIALMKDQIDQLWGQGIAAARMDSTLDLESYRAVIAGLQSGELKLLYVAPERFTNERFRRMLDRLRVSLFAVDEAHCISEWGHNFRPDYLKLAELAKAFGAERVLALTATATPAVLQDICRGFDIAPGCAVRTPFYRDNLTLLTTPVTAETQERVLLQRLADRPRGATIVYVTRQKRAEDLAKTLARAGFTARPYHAGLKDEERHAIQEWFLGSEAAGSKTAGSEAAGSKTTGSEAAGSKTAGPEAASSKTAGSEAAGSKTAGSEAAVVVATIAFGMGIDKADIRYVYHVNPPKSLENLAQEIGRAGRDGQPATCELLICSDDLGALRNFAYGDTPTAEAVAGLVKRLFPADRDLLELSLYHLGRDLDIRPLVLRTLLTYLELDGLLQALTPRFEAHRFKPLEPLEAILDRFEGERRTFLDDLFAQAQKARVWLQLDLDAAARALRQPRDRVARAMDYLADQGWLELRPSGVRHRYEIRRRPRDRAALVDTLRERLRERERREQERLDQVITLAQLDGCQTSALGAHFGEPLPGPCGHCSHCLTGKPAPLPPEPDPPIDPAPWREIEALRRDEPEALGPPRALARFAAGLTSPRTSAARLTRHPRFGALAHVRFPRLLKAARAR